MIIEFAKGIVKLSVRCEGSTNIGHIADSLSKWAEVIDNLTELFENDSSALAFALEGLCQGIPLNLLDLAQRADATIQQYHLQITNQVSPSVTLWWAPKPLAREQTLAGRFADNGDRTRIAVALRPLDPNAIVEQPMA